MGMSVVPWTHGSVYNPEERCQKTFATIKKK